MLLSSRLAGLEHTLADMLSCLLFSRLAGLEPIVDNVLEFDTLKNTLEEWCIQEQETVDQLPLLEVTKEKLLLQQKECHALLEGCMAQVEPLQKLDELAEQFLRDTEVGVVITRLPPVCARVRVYMCMHVYMFGNHLFSCGQTSKGLLIYVVHADGSAHQAVFFSLFLSPSLCWGASFIVEQCLLGTCLPVYV